MDADRESKIRLCEQSCELIHRVYHYLMAEYEYTVSRMTCTCDVSHLRETEQRTADAVGVHVSTVRHVLATVPAPPAPPSYCFDFTVVNNARARIRASTNTTDKQTNNCGIIVEGLQPDRDNDNFIEIDYGEPETKKVKLEEHAVIGDGKTNDEDKDNYVKKLVDFITFEEGVPHEVEIKQEHDVEDETEQQQGELVVYDSITIKDECIM